MLTVAALEILLENSNKIIDFLHADYAFLGSVDWILQASNLSVWGLFHYMTTVRENGTILELS